jgi:hypothetical protein
MLKTLSQNARVLWWCERDKRRSCRRMCSSQQHSSRESCGNRSWCPSPHFKETIAQQFPLLEGISESECKNSLILLTGPICLVIKPADKKNMHVSLLNYDPNHKLLETYSFVDRLGPEWDQFVCVRGVVICDEV